jgi:hypothetical protein
MVETGLLLRFKLLFKLSRDSAKLNGVDSNRAGSLLVVSSDVGDEFFNICDKTVAFLVRTVNSKEGENVIKSDTRERGIYVMFFVEREHEREGERKNYKH